MSQMTRRGFLGGALAGGGALCLAVSFGCGGGQRQRMIRRADETGELAPNMYVTVMPDGRIALTINKAEIGQGVTMVYTTLVAEELEVPRDRIDYYYADSHPQYRTSFGMHQTGGSTSTKEAWVPLRKAGAAAREMLVAAAANEWGVPASACGAKDGVVVHQASGREAGYGELTAKAARQEIPENPRLKKPSEFRVIGKQARRVDARPKVDGTAIFGTDVSVPGMVRAYVIHAPVYGARPESVRADSARKQRGVIDVVSFRWGVAVVAEKYWQAMRAARDVEVEWGEGLVEGLDTDELQAAARAYRKSGTAARDDGDVSDALGAKGARKVEATYEVPYLAHATMEPQNCTVKISGGKAEVWVPCQIPTVVQEFVGDALGIGRDDVLVHTTYCGGGFGRRGVGDFAAQAAMIAKKVGRPVQMIWSRESDMKQAFYRPPATTRMRGAVDASGRATALAYHGLSQPISMSMAKAFGAAMPGWMPRAWKSAMAKSALAMFGSGTMADIFSTEGAANTPYRIPNLKVEFTPINTKLPVSFWRSVGHSYNGFVMESFIDELAFAAKRDPYELRRDLLEEGSRELRVLDAVAKLGAWGEPAVEGFAKGIARHTSFESEVAEIAEVGVVDGRIRVTRVWCVVECGVAVNPDVVKSQMESAIVFGLSAALDQEITLKDGVVQQGNFDDFPAIRMHECPEITVTIVESDEAPTGVGEPGLPPLGAAVANALFGATGVRLRSMPLQKAWDARGES